MGCVDPKMATELVKNLRAIKIMQNKTDDLYACVPKTIEIAFLPSNEILNLQYSETLSTTSTNNSDQEVKEKFFPGIFLSTQPARFVRPVQNLEHGGIEFIGPLE